MAIHGVRPRRQGGAKHRRRVGGPNPHQYLMDNSTGLRFHGWQFTDSGPDAKAGHKLRKRVVVGGLCWVMVAIAIPLFLDIFDQGGQTGVDGAKPVRRMLVCA